ncbi:MAG: helix-turn-helix domain-containing protein [Fusobacterium ulcerans]|uniref:helix-turn-helix domain-containing protein n=1 Tax=Fusobacterium ulcerans TaxID=861 RepID=UPI003A89E89E
MKLTLEQRKVKKMYIEGKTAKQIAKETGINISSIYRWIKDPKLEFKKSKELAEFSTEDMSTIVDESHKKLLMEIAENPNKLLDPKTADSLCKVAKFLESLDAKSAREKALSVEGEEAQEAKGVLIIDDITLEFIKKKAEEDLGTPNT